MAQQLRTSAVLPEDPSSDPASIAESENHLSAPGDLYLLASVGYTPLAHAQTGKGPGRLHTRRSETE